MKELRPYQQVAVDFIEKKLNEYRKPFVYNLPTGSGKTVVVREIARRFGKVLVLTLSVELCTQDFEEMVEAGVEASVYSAGAGSKEVGDITVATILSAYKHPELFDFVDVVLLDECIDGDNEVLTPDGWVKISTMPKVIAQYDKGKIDFVEVSRWVEKVADEVVETTWGGQYGRGEVVYMTKNHRQPVRKTRGKLGDLEKVVPASSLTSKSNITIPCAAIGEPSDDLPYLDMLKIAICADGHIEKRKTLGTWVRLSFRKERKIARAKWLLEKCGIPYKESVNSRGDTNICFHLDCTKRLNQLERTTDFSTNYWRIWELAQWDGTVGQQGTMLYYATDKTDAETAREWGVLGGTRTSIHEFPSNRNYWTVSFAQTDHMTTAKMKKRVVKWGKKVYCPTVPSSFFLVKKGEMVFVTGNCDSLNPADIKTTFMKLLIAINKVKRQDGKKIKIVGLTASPWRSVQKLEKRGKWYKTTTLIQPLNRIPCKGGFLWGEIVEGLTTKQAMNMGYLTPVEYYSSPLDPSKLVLNSTGNDYTEDSLDVWGMTAVERCFEVMVGAEKKWRVKSGIVALPFIRHCEALQQLCEANGVSSTIVTSKTPQKARKEAIRAFKNGEIKWLVQSGVAVIGFNSPITDTLVWCRPTVSLRTYVQAVGRVMRLAEGKTVARVLDLAGTYQTFGPAEDVRLGKEQGYKTTIVGAKGQISGRPLREFSFIKTKRVDKDKEH